MQIVVSVVYSFNNVALEQKFRIRKSTKKKTWISQNDILENILLPFGVMYLEHIATKYENSVNIYCSLQIASDKECQKLESFENSFIFPVILLTAYFIYQTRRILFLASCYFLVNCLIHLYYWLYSEKNSQFAYFMSDNKTEKTNKKQ